MTPKNTGALTVAVLMGGTSSEREISLRSGEAVIAGLRAAGFRVRPLRLDEDHLERSDVDGVDCAFIVLHGGFGENGDIQKILAGWNVPFTGSDAQACQLCIRKDKTKAILLKEKIPTPRFWTCCEGGPSLAKEDLPFPCAVKPVMEGSSIGITRVVQESELDEALRKAWCFGPLALIEEWIEGDEVTATIMGDQVLPLIQIRPKATFYTYGAKYESGQTEYLVPAPYDFDETKLMKEVALRAFNACSCYGYGRIDLIWSHDKIPHVLEINTNPGFTKTSLVPKAAMAQGMIFEALCAGLVDLALGPRISI